MTTTLLSLCCSAPPSGDHRVLSSTTSGVHVGFCSACGHHSPFAPQGEGRVKMVLPPLEGLGLDDMDAQSQGTIISAWERRHANAYTPEERQQLLDRGLKRIERHRLWKDLFGDGLGLVCLLLTILFVGGLLHECGQGGHEGLGQEKIGSGHGVEGSR